MMVTSDEANINHSPDLDGNRPRSPTQVMHDSALAVRRPGECTYFTPGCEVSVDKVEFTPEMIRVCSVRLCLMPPYAAWFTVVMRRLFIVRWRHLVAVSHHLIYLCRVYRFCASVYRL